MPIYCYDHIHLLSPDPEKTARFYEKMFNAEIINSAKRPDGRTSVALDLYGSRILIINRECKITVDPMNEPFYGINHFGIKTDNLEEAVADLKTKGVKFTGGIRTIPSGAKITFLLAPDNVSIELLEEAK
ncbi:VOC family protein [Chloroflexota bacterium]